jgi:hypothetical protein
MRRVTWVVWALLAPAGLAAQATDAADPGPMRRLQWLVGEWRGSGWLEFAPGQRRPFTIRETAQAHAGGEVLLIEGLGKMPAPSGQGEIVVHQAFALVSWDAGAGRYAMRAYRSGAGWRDATLEVSDTGLVWGFEDPRGGRFRFTLVHDAPDQWKETGEGSRDGTTWRTFLRMELARQAPPDRN